MFSATTKEAANTTLSDVKNTAYSAKRDFDSASDDISNEFAQSANKAGRKVRNLIDTANDELHDATEVVTDEIRSNPIRSTAIALGVGFILGALLRR